MLLWPNRSELIRRRTLLEETKALAEFLQRGPREPIACCYFPQQALPSWQHGPPQHQLVGAAAVTVPVNAARVTQLV